MSMNLDVDQVTETYAANYGDPPTGWTPQQLPNPPAREDIPA